MRIFFFALFILLSNQILAQQRFFVINEVTFITIQKNEQNEYNSRDKYKNIYFLKNGRKIFLCKHCTYKYSADCNNIFKDFGSIQIKKDSLILKTHYTHKGFDPIPEWEKKVYIINKKRNKSHQPIYKLLTIKHQ